MNRNQEIFIVMQLFCAILQWLVHDIMHLSKPIRQGFPGGPVAKTHDSNAGPQVQSLVRELDPTCHS